MGFLQELINNTMNYSRFEKWMIILQIGILFLLSGLLYYEMTKRLDAGNAKIIGTITFKQRTVQRKYASRVVWEDMEQHFPLRNKDSIRTATAADAEITLNDGTKIQLNENSMILLNLDEDKTNIDFAYGSLSAQNAGSGDSKIQIKTGETSVSVGNGDVKLSKEEGKNLSVAVEKGEAEIVSLGKESQKIGSDEKATLQGSDGKLEIKKQELKQIAPNDLARFYTQENLQTVNFEFQSNPTYKNSKLEISQNSGFTGNIVSEKITGSNFKKSLKEGVYYWRLKSEEEISSVRKFTIYKTKSVDLVSPSNGQKIGAAEETVYLNLLWSKSELSSNYKLEISDTKDFGKLIQSTTTMVNSISLPLGKGKYFWRVVSTDPSGTILTSSVFSFNISEADKPKPPTLFNPQPGSNIDLVLAEKTGIRFNWSSTSSSSEFFLSQSPKFESVILQKTVDGNFLDIKEKLPAGIYHWKVSLKNKDGSIGESSAVRSFEIKTLGTIKLHSPKEDVSFSSKDVYFSGIPFSWEKLSYTGNYQLQISTDSSFSKIVKSYSSAQNKLTIKDLDEGEYVWRVVLLNSDGSVLISSSSQKLTVTSPLISSKNFETGEPGSEEEIPDLKLIFPSEGQTLNMTKSNSIRFRWSPVPGIKEYRFRLFNGKKEIYSVVSKNAQVDFKKLDLLDEGEFRWTVASADSGKPGENTSTFKVELDAILEEVEVLSPDVQYEE
ncbi:sigma factor regulatory protein FecR [Leptospira kobayashii]|uniref:Sigma factor regulatory protein FecR n=2 Tax=Leptospira kobayashii TaxID=1917830 RepID=A0ABM7UIQ5_9LEPT|nr:sigma factor regulatory protein FecR [Leptospira kobayashii]